MMKKYTLQTCEHLDPPKIKKKLCFHCYQLDYQKKHREKLRIYNTQYMKERRARVKSKLLTNKEKP